MNAISKIQFTKTFFVRLALICAMLASLAVLTTSAQAAVTFRNPLNNSGPDPFMIVYNGNYYLAATTWGGASTGLTMRKASTIAALKTASAQQIWQDSTASRCCNYWAPEFHLINGHWYGYFTGGASGTNYTVTQHIHVIESSGTDPMGPYTYKGQLVSRAALDGSIVTIGSTMYAIYSVWNTKQEIAIKQMTNPWTTTGSEVVIVSPTLSWEIQDGTVAEGPIAFQRNGATYIVYSASACWGPNYKLGQTKYTGTNPLSAASWTKKTTPIFQQGNGVYGPGHNSFFKSMDGTEEWIIYHANSTTPGACDMGRTPRIQKFTVNADGSPNLGTPISTSTDINVPSGEPAGGPTPTPGTYYRITNRNSGKVMDVQTPNTADNAKIGQYTANGQPWQDWQFVDKGSGYFNIVSRNSGKCLDVTSASTADGAQMIQWACGTGNNQQFQWAATGSYFNIIARHSSKCVNVVGSSTADAALLEQRACASGNSFQWSR